MAKVNLTQGAKLAGISRSTLNRHLKGGKVSKGIDASGKPCVDTSELQRFYGSVSHGVSPRCVPITQHGTPPETVKNTTEIALLRAELDVAKERLEETQKDRDEWKGQAKTLSLLLTDQRPEKAAARQRGFWSGIFGRSKTFNN